MLNKNKTEYKLYRYYRVYMCVCVHMSVYVCESVCVYSYRLKKLQRKLSLKKSMKWNTTNIKMYFSEYETLELFQVINLLFFCISLNLLRPYI